MLLFMYMKSWLHSYPQTLHWNVAYYSSTESLLVVTETQQKLLLKTGMAYWRLQIYAFLTALNRESSDIKIVFFSPLHYILVCNFCYCFFHSSATRFVWKPKTKWSSTGKWSEVPGNKIWNQLLRTYLILYITRLSVFYLQ